MLSPLDADLVRRDAGLPGLATVLDPDALTRALKRSLPDAECGTAQISHVRYKPGTSCLVVCRLQASAAEVDVYAQTFRRGAAAKLQKVLERPAVPGPLGPGRIVLEDGATAVSIFPNDRRLKALPLIAEAESSRRFLRKLLRERPDLWEASVGRLAYKPERRYVGRLLVDGVPRAVVKVYTALAYISARRGAEAFGPRGSLRLARLLGRADGRCALAAEWLPGQPASEVIADPGSDRAAAWTIGAALAELHLQDSEGLACLTRDEEAAALLSLAGALGFLVPHLARRADVLAQRLAARLVNEALLSRPVHGDFYARQVLLPGDGAAAILDLDEAVRADPATDLGNFIADLERSALRGDLAADRVSPIADALLEGYRSRTRGPDPSRLVLYTAARLFRLAPTPFRYREPDWPERTEAIVARVEAILDGARASGGAHGRGRQDAAAAPADATMPFLSRALDPCEVQRLLRRLPRLTGASGEVRVLAVRLARHKPHRRCLIEYDVEVERADSPSEAITLFGKARARGLDEDGYRLLQCLWNTGFGADSADGICIPEPVGIVPELGMWLQRKAPGTPATRLLAEPSGAALATRIAEAIHKLHEARVPCRRRHSMADELRILHERLPQVGLTRPRWANRLERLLAACDRLGAATTAAGTRGIHRDFYADHVIAAGSRLYLIDFDLYCEGDPALDVGNFLGHLIEQSLRGLGNPAALADREAALLERFLELSGNALRFAAHSYTTLTLVRHVYLSTHFPERRPFTEALLELCEERLGVAGGAWAGREAPPDAARG